MSSAEKAVMTAPLLLEGEYPLGYEILGRIGAGGMGVVFKGRDLRLGRIVALKSLPDSLHYSNEEKEGFLREARALSALDHPNICTIFGLEESPNGRFFIAMGFYDGGTLADKIAAGPIPESDCVTYLLGILEGLRAAHRHNVIHRDIKPSNVLLSREGVPKIVDFGLARIVSDASATQSLNTSGTVAYMAPEQLRGEPVDARADLWAVGVLAAEMATGHHPFRRETLPAMALSICQDPPEILAPVPTPLLGFIYRCLSKTPNERYASSEEALTQLRTLQEQLGNTPPGPDRNRSQFPNDLNLRSQPRSLKSAIAAASGISSSPRRAPYIVGGVLIVLAAVLLVPGVQQPLRSALVGPKEKHIAVLPFEARGDKGADSALAEGLADSITDDLSNLPVGQNALWVVPSSVVRRQQITDPIQAYKTLGATLVVQGVLERSGPGITLKLNLINGESLRQVGSVSSTSELGDLAMVQQDTLVRLGRLLHVGVPGAFDHTGKATNFAAYDLYIEALGFLDRYDKPGNLDLAIDRLERATKQDPQFALGYSTLGESYRLKYKVDSNHQWIDRALEACKKAETLDPQISATFLTLGYLHNLVGQHDLATQELQRAVAIDNRNSKAVRGLATVHEDAGQLEEAEAGYKRAAALRPGDWDGYNSLARFYDRHSRYAEATEQERHAIELAPDSAIAYLNLGCFLLDAGHPADLPEAERVFQRSLALGPRWESYVNLGILYLRERRYRDSIVQTQRSLSLNNQSLLSWNTLALASRWVKDEPAATVAEEHLSHLATEQLKTDPRDAEAHSWLGLALARRGDRQAAATQLESALALEPTNQQVLVNSIAGYATVGDQTSARRLLAQAQRSNIPVLDLQFDPGSQDLVAKVR